MNTHSVIDSSLGELTLVTSGDALVGVYFPGHWTRPNPAWFGPRIDGDAITEATGRQLSEYLAGARRAFDLPVTVTGDPLDRRVWALLADIPYGETVTYGALAQTLGNAAAARDIGAAVGRNPLCIVLPCHRVVGKDGRLTGYAGGLARKRALLDLEAAAVGTLATLF